jgi:galactose mutarotase-like enzyme
LYTLKEIETDELYYLELASSNGESTAQICLNQVGRLSNFSFENTQIIKEFYFSTPEYDFNISSTSKENFLQLYTPVQPNVIAIEPMTGAADNFNNNIGLQTLHPKDTYIVRWNMAIETLNTNQLIHKLCNS